MGEAISFLFQRTLAFLVNFGGCGAISFFFRRPSLGFGGLSAPRQTTRTTWPTKRSDDHWYGIGKPGKGTYESHDMVMEMDFGVQEEDGGWI